MSTKKADKVTIADLRRVVKWFRRVMAMQDWRIRVEFSASVPAWCTWNERSVEGVRGRNWSAAREKVTWIWVNKAIVDTAPDAINVIIHECLHAQFTDIGIEGKMGEPNREFVLCRLADQLVKAYLSSC